jgi:hypothetical protein
MKTQEPSASKMTERVPILTCFFAKIERTNLGPNFCLKKNIFINGKF